MAHLEQGPQSQLIKKKQVKTTKELVTQDFLQALLLLRSFNSGEIFAVLPLTAKGRSRKVLTFYVEDHLLKMEQKNLCTR